jgi:hypothetical protein
MEPARRKRQKRPCRICRKWFSPDPRLGDRQKTCGAKACQRLWHAKRCAEWNQENRAYFQEIHLAHRLQQTQDSCTSPPSASPPSPPCPTTPISANFPRLPRSTIQEVIGAQQLIIIEYVARILFRSVQEVIRSQQVEVIGKLKQHLTTGCLRGESQGPGS